MHGCPSLSWTPGLAQQPPSQPLLRRRCSCPTHGRLSCCPLLSSSLVPHVPAHLSRTCALTLPVGLRLICCCCCCCCFMAPEPTHGRTWYSFEPAPGFRGMRPWTSAAPLCSIAKRFPPCSEASGFRFQVGAALLPPRCSGSRHLVGPGGQTEVCTGSTALGWSRAQQQPFLWVAAASQLLASLRPSLLLPSASIWLRTCP